MLENNKGFTVVELIVSFAFVSLLSVSLFQAVLNYRDKQEEAGVETRLIEFKNKLTLQIQKDIETRLLKEISYCSDGSGIINRCARLSFMDETYKDLIIDSETKTEDVCFSNKPIEECSDKDLQHFDVTKTFVIYGDVVYDIPDGYNIDFDNQYLLQYTTVDDDIENKQGLYRLSIGLRHRNYDIDLDINIVTTGLARLENSSVTYPAYRIGDIVEAEVGKNDIREFYVLENSGENNATILLLSKEDESTMAFNTNTNFGNDYEGSAIEQYLTNELYNRWESLRGPKYIRLPSFEQVASLNNFCPERKYSAADIENFQGFELKGTGHEPTRSRLNEFWYGDFWTMDGFYDLDENLKVDKTKVWYVEGNKSTNEDGSTNEIDSKRMLKADTVTNEHGVRPVIELDKKYITKDILKYD